MMKTIYSSNDKYHVENKNIDSMFSVEISRNNFKIKSQQFFQAYFYSISLFALTIEYQTAIPNF